MLNADFRIYTEYIIRLMFHIQWNCISAVCLLILMEMTHTPIAVRADIFIYVNPTYNS